MSGGPITDALADFAAGAKNEARYAGTGRDGEIYRKTWQQARRDAEAVELGLDKPRAPAPEPVPAEKPPAPTQSMDDVPDFVVSPRDDRLPPIPADVDLSGMTPGSPIDVPMRCVSPPPTHEDRRLQAGEDKPRKKNKKPEPADQLGLF